MRPRLEKFDSSLFEAAELADGHPLASEFFHLSIRIADDPDLDIDSWRLNGGKGSMTLVRQVGRLSVQRLYEAKIAPGVSLDGPSNQAAADRACPCCPAPDWWF